MSMLNIDEDKLRDLIHRRSRSIKSYGYTIGTGLSLAGFILTLLSFDLNQITFWKALLLSVFAAFYVFLFVHSFFYRYSDEAFYHDIVRLADNHAFSLLVLTSPAHPGRYLLVKDRRWGTFLLPYLRTHVDDDKQNVQRFLETTLRISRYQMTQTKSQEMTKVSVSANLQKTFQHTFYGVEFDVTGTPFEKAKAKVNGLSYRWMSIDDMKCDKRVMARNGDVVAFVEANF